MNPPPPCVSKTNPLYTRWRFRMWQKAHRTELNKYNMTVYYAKKRGQYQNGTKPAVSKPVQTDPLEADRKYREEMAAKGIYL